MNEFRVEFALWFLNLKNWYRFRWKSKKVFFLFFSKIEKISSNAQPAECQACRGGRRREKQNLIFFILYIFSLSLDFLFPASSDDASEKFVNMNENCYRIMYNRVEIMLCAQHTWKVFELAQQRHGDEERKLAFSDSSPLTVEHFYFWRLPVPLHISLEHVYHSRCHAVHSSRAHSE